MKILSFLKHAGLFLGLLIVCSEWNCTGFIDVIEPDNPFGYGNGQVTFYTNCSSCGQIIIRINGKEGRLTQYYPIGKPDCNVLPSDNSAYSFTARAGVYSFTAVTADGKYSWASSAVVSERTCTSFLLH